VSKQPLTIPVSGAADSGLRSGLVTRYGWSGQMTNEPGAVRADEKARYVQAQMLTEWSKRHAKK
jgi:hypothetical protein